MISKLAATGILILCGLRAPYPDFHALAAEGYSYSDTAPVWAYLSGPAACRKWATKHLDRYLQPESLVVADA